MDYTLDQKIACLSREVGMRRRVYPRQVERGNLPQAKAESELGCMEAILTDYQDRKRREEPGLFDMEGGQGA